MLTPWELDRQIDERARVLKAQAPMPGHSAAAAANEAASDNIGVTEAERRRRRIQHEADPCPVDAPEVVEADLDKAYREASDVPSGYPPMGPVNPEMFQRGPIRAGEAAYGPGYQTPDPSVPTPPPPPRAESITRPLIMDGQSRPCAPEEC